MGTTARALLLMTVVSPVFAQAPVTTQPKIIEPTVIDELPLLPAALLHCVWDSKQPIHLEATFSPDGHARSIKVVSAPLGREKEFQAWGMDWKVDPCKLKDFARHMKGQIFLSWSAESTSPQWKFEYDAGESHDVSTAWNLLSIKSVVIVETEQREN